MTGITKEDLSAGNEQCELDFSGATFNPGFDYARLTGQLRRIWNVMKGGQWRTLREIENLTGDGSASISAQLRNLRKQSFGSHIVERQPRGARENGLYEYRVVKP